MKWRSSLSGWCSVISVRRWMYEHFGEDDNRNRVGKQLCISIKTVETHRARIMRKLDVHNIGELIRLAARQGLLAD